MAARGQRKRAPPKKKFMTKLKQDPIKTIKDTVKQTGPLQLPIAAYALGAIGGVAMAAALTRVPVIGGILSVMATKGAKLTSGFSK